MARPQSSPGQASTWLTRQLVMRCAALLLALELAGFIFFVAGTHGWIVPLGHPVSTDFVSFYAAGQLADGGHAALAYDQMAHHAAEQAATEPGIRYNFFYYPPVYLLLCAVLAHLPYLTAFVAFEAVTLLAALAVGLRILDHGWSVALPLLAFPAVWYTLGTGQNALLTAALFGAATLLVDRRPLLAGLLFGALCYKPHFGLLVPVALVSAGRWRAIVGAIIGVVALVGASALAFGWHTWVAYGAVLTGARSVYEGRVSLAGLASPFGAARVLGCPPSYAYAIQALATLAMIAAVAVVWRSGRGLPVRAAVLAAATPLAVPVVMYYDLMLSGLAMAWLARWGQARGAPSWLATSLALLFVATLLTGNFDPGSHLLLAPLIALVVFALTIAAAATEGGVDLRYSASARITA